MLDPRGRQLLLASLRPPDGFKFDCAVGTTFSLDLIALLTTPLAFAMFDWQDDQGRLAADPALPTADPLTLLESLRRCANRIHIYCQAGQIKVPPANQRLLAYLEQAVIEVQPPAAKHGRQAVFHPKVWAIRYTGPSDAVRYRMLCLSRNLTFDRSWDTVLLLDGELTSRQNGFSENRPLGEFFAGLPSLAIRPDGLGSDAKKDSARVGQELRLVKWELPDAVEEIRFWPMGMSEKASWPFSKDMDRLLVISPFLTEHLLNRLSEAGGERFLISRAESLQEIPPDLLNKKWKCFTLDEGVEAAGAGEEPAEDEKVSTEPADLTGLHAKMFIVDAGWKAHVWTGSANATGPAFGGNVEFLTELIGKKSVLGIDAAIGERPESQNLRSMLVEFSPASEAIKPDENIKKAEILLDAARRAICDLPMVLRLQAGDSAGLGFVSTVESSESLSIPTGVTMRCRPIMLPPADAKQVETGKSITVHFGPHAPESISSFVSFVVTARVGGIERAADFVLNLPLIGAPSDRKDRVLRDLLRDSQTLLRFLMLLLADDPERLFEELRQLAMGPEGTDTGRPGDLLPLLEHMLRALHKCPDKLHQVNSLIEDLRKTPEGQSILPAELEQVWDPIRRVLGHTPANACGGVR
jgi:hypothetical protein